MAYFINYCRQIVYLDKDQDLVELSYSKYIEGFGYEKFTDYFKTKIIGTSNEIVIQGTKRSVRYEQFLDTMLEKTTETRRKMVLVQLGNVLLENKNVHSLIRIMNTVKILDSTFVPPFINVTCSWQKRMVKEFCLLTFPKVIESSVSDHKLDLTFRVLQLIESELQ